MERLYPILFAVTVACAVGSMYLYLQGQKAATAAMETPAASQAQGAPVRTAVEPLQNKVCVMQGGKKEC